MHLVPVQPSFSRPPPLLFRHQLQCLNGLSSGRGRCSGEVAQAALPRDDPAHPSQHPLVHLLAVPASLSWQLSRTISGTGRHVRRNPILPNDCSLSPHVWSTAADKPALTGSYVAMLSNLALTLLICEGFRVIGCSLIPWLTQVYKEMQTKQQQVRALRILCSL